MKILQFNIVIQKVLMKFLLTLLHFYNIIELFIKQDGQH